MKGEGEVLSREPPQKKLEETSAKYLLENGEVLKGSAQEELRFGFKKRRKKRAPQGRRNDGQRPTT